MFCRQLLLAARLYSDSTTGGPSFTLNNVAVDGLGRLKEANETITDTDGNTVANSLGFKYDMRSQLISHYTYIDDSYWHANYIYHDNGDMAYRTIQLDSQSFYYTGHRMTNADGNMLDYDENGNMIEDASARSLKYNWDNKLRSAKDGNDTLLALRYDPAGNRIYRETNNGSTKRKFIVDIVGDLPVILLVLDDSQNVLKKYIYANSQIVAQHDVSDNNKLYFYLHDRLGSVRQIINASGTVVKYYTYQPFGETLESGGTFANPFKFSGQFFDDEIDEYYLRARQYDPYISRFTSRDPVFGQFQEPLTLHVYLYCQNDPVDRIDLFGRDYVDINFTWTYGMAAGMLQGGIIGSGFGPVGTGIGAGVGLVAGGFGITGGVMYERDRYEAHLYLGPSWTTNIPGGIDFTMSVCPSPYTTVEQGWHFAISGSISGAYTQRGRHLASGDMFQEFGMTSGTSMGYRFGVSVFYVFPEIGVPSFTGSDPRSAFSDLDLLDRAIMINTMREDTAKLIGGGTAGIAFYSTYAVTANILLDM